MELLEEAWKLAFHASSDRAPTASIDALAETLIAFIHHPSIPSTFKYFDSLKRFMATLHLDNTSWRKRFYALSEQDRKSDVWYLDAMASLWPDRAFFTTKKRSLGAALASCGPAIRSWSCCWEARQHTCCARDLAVIPGSSCMQRMFTA